MLQKLYIQNYAIIDELEITWGNHLNIITGETGAGKSILLGALSLILGERADSAALYSAEKKMVVEGVFAANGNKAVHRFLVQNELDNEEQLCIRREVAVNGKSRAFVNDTPVTLAQLQQLAGMLVDLHQQFDTQELSSQHFQREVIDLFAGNSALLVKYEQVYKQYTADKKQLNQLLAEQAQAQKEMDYHKFLYDELSEAAFNENELEELDGELKMLGSAEHIKSVLAQMSAALQEGDEPLAQRVKQLLQSARGIASVHPGMDAIAERLHAAQVELQDIAGELDAINDRLQYNPERMQWVGDRLATGYKLFKKTRGEQYGRITGHSARTGRKTKRSAGNGQPYCRITEKYRTAFYRNHGAGRKTARSPRKATGPVRQKSERPAETGGHAQCAFAH